jgi:hypothetical protein
VRSRVLAYPPQKGSNQYGVIAESVINPTLSRRWASVNAFRVDSFAVAKVAAKPLSSAPMLCDTERGGFWSNKPVSQMSQLMRHFVRR